MAVSFKQVTKRFADGTVALDRLDLDFELGEFVVLLGPSGSGKTTACRLLAGLETPSSGRIEIDGKDVTDLPPRFRGIGMVFQNYALYSHKTVFENIAYPLRIRKVPAAEIEQSGQGRGRPVADRRLPAPQAGAAFRRPGAARRGGARAGVGAGDLPDGRTALQPRCAVAPPHAHRAQPPAPQARQDLRLRHPRPGRGDDAGDAHRRAEGRPAWCSSTSPARSTAGPPTASSPSSWAARR